MYVFIQKILTLRKIGI